MASRSSEPAGAQDAGHKAQDPRRKPGRWRRALRWPAACAMLALAAWLLYRSPLVREGGVKVLGKIGRPVIPLLRRAIADNDMDVRTAAGDAIVALGPAAVGPLVATLADDDPEVRRQSARALGLIGHQAREASGPLREAMSDPDPLVRQFALAAFCATGPDLNVALAALTGSLKDEDRVVRTLAAESLGRLGRRAQAAIPALREAANDPDTHARDAAEEALERIAPQPHRPGEVDPRDMGRH